MTFLKLFSIVDKTYANKSMTLVTFVYICKLHVKYIICIGQNSLFTCNNLHFGASV